MLSFTFFFFFLVVFPLSFFLFKLLMAHVDLLYDFCFSLIVWEESDASSLDSERSSHCNSAQVARVKCSCA